MVGGAIAGGISWHWIFWLNVPIGLALMPLAARKLSESFGPRPQLDLVGLALAGLAALGVTWALVRAGSVGWGSVEIIGSLAGGLVLAGLFVEWERRSRNPMLPLELFRDRTFASTNVVSFFMYAALFGTLFLMAQFFQIALGNSPLRRGPPPAALDRGADDRRADRRRALRALRQPTVHGRRSGTPDNRSWLDRVDRDAGHGLPPARARTRRSPASGSQCASRP